QGVTRDAERQHPHPQPGRDGRQRHGQPARRRGAGARRGAGTGVVRELSAGDHRRPRDSDVGPAGARLAAGAVPADVQRGLGDRLTSRAARIGRRCRCCSPVTRTPHESATWGAGLGLRSKVKRSLTTAVLAALCLGIVAAQQAAVSRPVHLDAIPTAGGPWLDRFNAWRASVGLPNLTEDATYSSGDAAHAYYMVKSGNVTHSED